jgi:hypothetical protein
MKKSIILTVYFAVLTGSMANLYPQCIPDANCHDTLLPGEICPSALPDAFLGIPYNQTVTILPPPTAILYDVGITIFKIHVDTVSNLPPGIMYETNATDMFPGTAYCVLLSGTPTDTGKFTLNIGVIPFIMLLDSVVEAPVVFNDSSVTIIVHEPPVLESEAMNESFSIISTLNPFPETTTLAFTLDESCPVRLHVYDCVGRLVYRETVYAKPGRNTFGFTGAALSKGYYLFTVIKDQSVLTGKLIKSR